MELQIAIRHFPLHGPAPPALHATQATTQRTARGPERLEPLYRARDGGCFATSPTACPLSSTSTKCRAWRPA